MGAKQGEKIAMKRNNHVLCQIYSFRGQYEINGDSIIALRHFQYPTSDSARFVWYLYL